MCNRYVAPDQAAIERFWHIGRHNPPRWWEADVFPRQPAPFIRLASNGVGPEVVVGLWSLIPAFAKTAKLQYSTNNARIEGVATAPTYRQPWARKQRCVIPAWSFDEPCWETGKNVWWRFSRADGTPWGLAGIWNTWIDRATGEVVESFSMLTMNADRHPLMSRMHKPDPKLPADQQDKRSVVVLEPSDLHVWLQGSEEEALSLVRLAPQDAFIASPA